MRSPRFPVHPTDNTEKKIRGRGGQGYYPHFRVYEGALISILPALPAALLTKKLVVNFHISLCFSATNGMLEINPSEEDWI